MPNKSDSNGLLSDSLVGAPRGSGLNELFPLNPWTYEAQNPSSLAPVAFRRDPFTGKATGGWDWAIPGAIRAMMNDVGIAATSPRNALMGGLSEDQIREAAWRSASGLTLLGGSAPSPEGLVSGIFGGGKAAKGPFKDEATLWNEFQSAYQTVKNGFADKLMVKIDPSGLGKKGPLKLVTNHGEEWKPSTPMGKGLMDQLNEAYDAYHSYILPTTKAKTADEMNENYLLALGETPKGWKSVDEAFPQKTEQQPFEKSLPFVEKLNKVTQQMADNGIELQWQKSFDSDGPAQFALYDKNSGDPVDQGELEDHLGRAMSELHDAAEDEWKKLQATPAPAKYVPKKKIDPALAPYATLTPHPLEKMRPETPSGLDWEYEREYGRYAKDLFPDAFKSREDFQQKYDAAPLRHLEPRELNKLEYFSPTMLDWSGGAVSQAEKEDLFHAGFQERRDTKRILSDLDIGLTAPPIVLRHDNGMRLLAGNTRLNAGLARGVNVPVKVIDIRKRPLRGSDVFDPSHPLSTEERQANFQRWFKGSKVVDENGNPLRMYHGTEFPNIQSLDARLGHSYSSRPFVSLSSDPKFVSNWTGQNEYEIANKYNDALYNPEARRGITHYPVFVSAKNPGDFRNPKHVEDLLNWHREDYVKAYIEKGFSEDHAIDKAEEDIKRIRKPVAGGDWSYWENPEAWRDLGWDAAYMRENASDPRSPLNIAVPNPGQLKSIFNKGEWDPDNPDILHSGGSFLGGALAPLFTPVKHDPFSDEYKEKVKEARRKKK